MVDLINNKNTYLKVQSDDFKKEYLEYLKDYVIKYRDRINLPKEYTFGIEIEYDATSGEIAYTIENMIIILNLNLKK